MMKTDKIIVIENGERQGLLNNNAYEISHYMVGSEEINELQFKQTDGQTLFKVQFKEIREVADPIWLHEMFLPTLEKLITNERNLKWQK